MSEIVMKYGDIKGECQIDGFVDQIVIDNVSFSASQAMDQTLTNQRTVKSVECSDVTLSRQVDKSSVHLLRHCMIGKSTAEVVITLLRATAKADKAHEKFMEITLKNVLVSNYSWNASSGQPYETITLNYTEVKFVYLVQKEDGSMDAGNIVASYDKLTGKTADK